MVPGITRRPKVSAPFLIPLAVGIVTVLVYVPWAALGVDAHHDGLMLKTALDVLGGQTLFRDTFCQYGALTPLAHAAALAVFGPRLLVLKVLTVVAYGITAALLVSTWRRVLPVPLAIVAVLLWVPCAPFLTPRHGVMPWSSALALCLQAASMLALCRAVEGGRTVRWAFACGALSFAAVLARTPLGVVHTAALSAAWLYLCVAHPDGRRVRRGAVAFAGGVATTALGFAALLVASGTVGPWYEQTVEHPRRWAGSRVTDVAAVVRHLVPLDEIDFRLEAYARGVPVPPFSPAASAVLLLGFAATVAYARRRAARAAGVLAGLAVVSVAVLALDHVLLTTPVALAVLAPVTLVVAMAASGLATLVRGDADGTAALGVALALPAAFAWHQYVPLSESYHVFWSLGLLAGGFAWALWRITRGRTDLVLLVLAALALPIVAGRMADVRAKRAVPTARVDGVPVLDGMSAPVADAAAIERAHAAIRGVVARRPAITARALGRDALMLTFVENRTNASPWIAVWPGLPPVPAEETDRLLAVERPILLFDPAQRRIAATTARQGRYAVIDDGPLGIVLAPAELTEVGQ